MPWSCRSEVLLLHAETVDLEAHRVAGAQVAAVGSAEGDARGCARVDDVTGPQHHELADVPDQVVHAERHVRRRTVLARLAIDPQAQPERLWIVDLVGRHEPRTERVE